jgi:hypothetical protein
MRECVCESVYVCVYVCVCVCAYVSCSSLPAKHFELDTFELSVGKPTTGTHCSGECPAISRENATETKCPKSSRQAQQGVRPLAIDHTTSKLHEQ